MSTQENAAPVQPCQKILGWLTRRWLYKLHRSSATNSIITVQEENSDGRNKSNQKRQKFNRVRKRVLNHATSHRKWKDIACVLWCGTTRFLLRTIRYTSKKLHSLSMACYCIVLNPNRLILFDSHVSDLSAIVKTWPIFPE
jgi:hypothetical protein